jgi:hypothetical protein
MSSKSILVTVKRKLHGRSSKKNNKSLSIQKNKTIKKNTPRFHIDLNRNRNWHNWVSATSVKNWLLSDPLIDYLEEYGFEECISKEKLDRSSTTTLTVPKKVSTTKAAINILSDTDSFLHYIMNKGIEFERSVYDYFKQRYPNDITTIITDYAEARNPESVKSTFDAMMNGVPIIYQGVLYNDENKTYGIPDLLVRSDWLNILFLNQPVPNKDIKISAPFLKKQYHYRVIDIKWSTLRLRADGNHLLNCNRYPAYKGQLWIYTNALGALQGYNPNVAYILGRKWCYTTCGIKYNGSNRFEKLGIVDFSSVDLEYNNKTKDAITWIKELRTHGHLWSLNPPSRPELYPNMANYNDGEWHNVKEQLADDIKEITSLWMCGPKNRQIAHNAGIMKWTDPNCTPKMLGIKGDVVAPILSTILEVNTNTNNNILPDIIINNEHNWQNKSKLEFFVDIEYLNDAMLEEEKLNSLTFMLGLGYVVNNKWNYKCFVTNDLSIESEKKITNQFYNFINKQTRSAAKYFKSNEIPNIYHWSSTEYNFFNKEKKEGVVSQQLRWVDMLKIFKDEPIAIRGALKYGLKEISGAMHKLGYIADTWSECDIKDGRQAMVLAKKYYIHRDKSIMNRITQYNESDCKSMYNIITYLRKHHCPEKYLLKDDEYKDDEYKEYDQEPYEQIESDNASEESSASDDSDSDEKN